MPTTPRQGNPSADDELRGLLHKNPDGSLVVGPQPYKCGHPAAIYATNVRGGWEVVVGCAEGCQSAVSLIEFAKAIERKMDERAANGAFR